MNADCAFVIGSTHAVCQDYSVAGIAESPYVVLSDGCSSSRDTDIGARLLVKAAEQILLAASRPTATEIAEIHKESARRALNWATRAGLQPEAVDATLLTAHLADDKLILGCSGDGVIVLQSKSGAVDVYAVSYTSGYPLYPSYAYQPDRLRTLKDEGRISKEVRRFAAVGETLHLVETANSDSPTEVFSFKCSEYRYAVVLSDGIHSFFTTQQTETSKRVDEISLEQVFRDVVSFKSVRGAFVGRRLKSFLKACEAKGWQHRDDLAIAALHLED